MELCQGGGKLYAHMPWSFQFRFLRFIKKLFFNHCTLSFIAGCYCTDNDPITCPIGRCECEGQIRVNHDCTEAR